MVAWPAQAASDQRKNGSLYSGTQDVAAGKNTAAVFGLVVGIVAVLLLVLFGLGAWFAAFPGVGAIIWGSVGLNRASQHGVGKGMSIAALALGIVAVVYLLFLVILAALLFG